MGDAPRRVAVTGASGYIGTRLVRLLLAEPSIERILAIDLRPPSGSALDRVDFLRHDVSAPLDGLLPKHGIDTVVHLAFALRPDRDREAARRVNVGGTANLLRDCTGPEVARIVYLSSTSVYGAHPDNPERLTEDRSARPNEGFQYSEDKAASERLLLEFSESRRDVSSCILRCCPVVGPTADNFIARAFLKPVLVAVRGADPPMQLVHEDDLAEVLARCILRGTSGVYNVAGEGTIRWREMARTLGRRVLSLPAPLLYAATDVAWALRLQSDSRSSGLNLIRYRWTTSTDKIKAELGLELRYTAREAWQAFVDRYVGQETTSEGTGSIDN